MLNSFCVFSIHFNLILFYALGPTPTSGHHFEQQPTVGARPTKKSLEKKKTLAGVILTMFWFSSWFFSIFLGFPLQRGLFVRVENEKGENLVWMRLGRRPEALRRRTSKKFVTVLRVGKKIRDRETLNASQGDSHRVACCSAQGLRRRPASQSL